MLLQFSNDFISKEKVVLSLTMESNLIELGIKDKEFVVCMFKNYDLGKNTLGVMTAIADKVFYVAVNAMNDIEEMIFATGHEFVHVEQYLSDKLADNKDGGVCWKGKCYTSKYSSDPAAYFSLPWEVEAHDKQEVLFKNAIKYATPRLNAFIASQVSRRVASTASV